MAMNTDSSNHRLVSLLAVFAVAAVCVLLGLWQLDRAQQKRQIVKRQQAQRDAPVVVLNDAKGAQQLPSDVSRLEFSAVQVSGSWLKSREILLDNRVHVGRNGCHILTPLRITGTDTIVLVNRGWIGWGLDRSILPETTAQTGSISVTGRIALVPEVAFTFDTASSDDAEGDWPSLWQNLDLDRYAALLEREASPLKLLQFIIKMDANPQQAGAQSAQPDSQGNFSADPTDDGYIREWFEPTDLWIQRHIAYAVQWFGLAITVLGLYWYRRKRSARRRQS